MKITVDDTVYDYDPNALTLKESRLLQQQAGLTIKDLSFIDFTNPLVLTAVIWLCRYRDGELKLKFDDVDAPIADVTIDVEESAEDSPTQATQPGNGNGSPTEPTE